MFQLDDTFLVDVGLADLPEAEKQPFLQHIYQELELRVGTRLSDGMSDAHLAEFEAIIDKKMDIVIAWLTQFAPNYRNDESFLRMQQATQRQPEDPALLSEYASTRWLEANRPNYRDVVKQVLEELKQEIITNRATILGSTSSDQLAA
jgi:hypothetical protein